MKLFRFNLSGLPSWFIEEPSEGFKSKFPKKIIAVSIGKDDVQNVNSLSELPYSLSDVDYLFTYNQNIYKQSNKHYDEIWDWNIRNEDTPLEMLKVIPCDLSRFFIDSPENVDVILSLTPKNSFKNPLLFKPIIIKLNHELLKSIDLKKSLDKAVTTVYNHKNFQNIDTTEKWLMNIIEEKPIGLFGEPYAFSKKITDDNFKSKLKVSIADFFIGYSFRVPTLQEEFSLIELLEKEFSDFDSEVTIYENYSEILSRIEKACKEKGFKYTKKPGISITLNTKDFYNLGIEYSILDFLL